MGDLVLSDGQIRISGADVERCAEAMYRMREPIGSTKLAFEAVSPGKKQANRDAAIRILRVAFSTSGTMKFKEDPAQVFTIVGDEFYRMSAPVKSSEHPFESRSEYAQNWYREKARTYLWDVLHPYARQIANPQKTPSLNGTDQVSRQRLDAPVQRAIEISDKNGVAAKSVLPPTVSSAPAELEGNVESHRVPKDNLSPEPQVGESLSTRIAAMALVGIFVLLVFILLVLLL